LCSICHPRHQHRSPLQPLLPPRPEQAKRAYALSSATQITPEEKRRGEATLQVCLLSPWVQCKPDPVALRHRSMTLRGGCKSREVERELERMPCRDKRVAQ
jgi:hypothetical protein